MIVSDFEGFVWRVVWAAMLDAVISGRVAHDDDARVVAVLEWMAMPGFTAAARAEIAAGGKVRKL